MGRRTASRIGTDEGVCTVLVDSQNPKTVDGWNTFIFRREIERSLRKLAWAPVVDASSNALPDFVTLSDLRTPYSRTDKRLLADFLASRLKHAYGRVENGDFGTVSVHRLYAKEVQRHALATRREFLAAQSVRQVISHMVHFAASPNEEVEKRNGVFYFEYGLAKVRIDSAQYLVLGVVGVKGDSTPYYDQHVVAKFKADSEAPSLQGHLRIGESAVDIEYDSKYASAVQEGGIRLGSFALEEIYDKRFALILQAVDRYFEQRRAPHTVLITGGAGFVAGHLRRELMKANRKVALTDVVDAQLPDYRRVDLTDRDAVRRLVAEVRPESVVHLGAISFVPDAAKDPGLLERVNVGGTENLLRAMVEAGVPRREHDLPTFLFVSTAQVYNQPMSAYALSKASAEAVVLHYCREGIDAVIARPSNHTGPGQSEKFVIPSFVRQAKEIKAGKRTRFTVGNLDSIRDFADVRDVVRAYRILLERGVPTAVYNIGSNERISIRIMLEKIAALADVPMTYVIDQSLWRPTDASRELDVSQLSSLGWSATYRLDETLSDMFA